MTLEVLERPVHPRSVEGGQQASRKAAVGPVGFHVELGQIPHRDRPLPAQQLHPVHSAESQRDLPVSLGYRTR